MFIVSKKNFVIRRPTGGTYRIKKEWAGELPEDVAGSWLVQAAIRSGSIIASPGKKDRELERAEKAAAEKAAEFDIRSDAEGVEKVAAGESEADPDADEDAEEKAAEKGAGERGKK